VERRAIPGTDLELSVVGLGCWAIGGRDWGPDVRDDISIAAIHAALDVGIDWLDTAPIYGHGHADEVLARALGSRKRDVVIATKVGVRLDAGTGHATSDLSPSHVRADCEASLARLGVERIDLLQVHWPCEHGTPLADTIGELVRLRDEGKVRAFGLCNYDAAGLREALAHGPVATLQTPLSMVRREGEHEVLPACAEAGVPALVYETHCRGLLTGKYDAMPRFEPSDLRARDPRFWGARYIRIRELARSLGAVAERIRAPTETLAIAWALSRPGVAAAIVGAKTPEQVRANARAARIASEPRVLGVLDQIADAY
jgi:aryl-alcohol dehydrogenase-like predicted oxidoreductase